MIKKCLKPEMKDVHNYLRSILLWHAENQHSLGTWQQDWWLFYNTGEKRGLHDEPEVCTVRIQVQFPPSDRLNLSARLSPNPYWDRLLAP